MKKTQLTIITLACGFDDIKRLVETRTMCSCQVSIRGTVVCDILVCLCFLVEIQFIAHVDVGARVILLNVRYLFCQILEVVLAIFLDDHLGISEVASVCLVTLIAILIDGGEVSICHLLVEYFPNVGSQVIGSSRVIHPNDDI